jgi:ABC-type dipeptide/oligopeptide/nickel transport system permease subunit
VSAIAILGSGPSPTALAWRSFLRDTVSLLSAVIVLAAVAIALFAPLLMPHDPADADLLRRLQPPAWMEEGEWAYPLGCDGLGRDLVSRLMAGARVSLGVGFLVVALSTAIGLAGGVVAGYARGGTDAVLSRFADVLLGFPYLVFAIGLMGMMGPGLNNIVITLVIKEWVVPFRVARGETLGVAELEYVEAARAVGSSPWRIMRGEIMPNILSPVLVVATLRIAQVIIMEASLSFLGLGVQPPQTSWGAMVADGREFLSDGWWVSTFPGLAILIVVVAINLAGQGLREAFDPKLRR